MLTTGLAEQLTHMIFRQAFVIKIRQHTSIC